MNKNNVSIQIESSSYDQTNQMWVLESTPRQSLIELFVWRGSLIIRERSDFKDRSCDKVVLDPETRTVTLTCSGDTDYVLNNLTVGLYCYIEREVSGGDKYRN